jgi:GntR family transcriptional repressor for pyruvate dehydrogenase complex
MLNIITNIQAIRVESPVDKIILQLKQLITSGQLKPGDRLPAERQLAEKLGVGRSYVREAILKLEFYGLLKTSPQSGTYVSGLSIKILDNLISDIIKFNKDDFSALIEARYYIELDAVRLAAQRRTDADVAKLRAALEDYELKIEQGQNAVEEDMLFHIKIAQATKNSVIESMMVVLVPDLIKNIVENNICGKDRSRIAINEHRAILKAIAEQDVNAAGNAMAEHLDEVLQVARTTYAASEVLKLKHNV